MNFLMYSKFFIIILLKKKSSKEKIELFKKEVDFPPFVLFFPAFPILQLRISPKIYFSLDFERGYDINILKNDYSVYFDISGEAEVSISLEVGCYIPSYSSAVEISLTVGIKGILGSGKIGIKLTLFINEPKYQLEIYYRYNALKLNFYSLFKVKVNFGLIKFSFQFYLINKDLIQGLSDRKSKTEEHKFPRIK